jgi:hypothetical protein
VLRGGAATTVSCPPAIKARGFAAARSLRVLHASVVDPT